MAYSETVLRRAQARLAQEKADQEAESAARIEQIYRQQPRLREIDRALRQSVTKAVTAAFRKGTDTTEAIRAISRENLALQREREWLLEANDLDESALEPTVICPKCGGSGYVGAVMCECLQELCRQEQKKELSTLFGAESFEKFRLDLYPAQYDERLKTSPRTLMERTYRDTLSYAQGFCAQAPSLLFVGATGLGKTFLSGCIARTVADRGFSVSYAPVGRLLAAFEDDKFRPLPDASRTTAYFSCDLLIIDDLGTEMTTQFVVSALYQLLNTRLLEGKATIVSTNLPLNDIAPRYSAQIASRLLGTYRLYKFYGEDIRFKLK